MKQTASDIAYESVDYSCQKGPVQKVLDMVRKAYYHLNHVHLTPQQAAEMRADSSKPRIAA